MRLAPIVDGLRVALARRFLLAIRRATHRMPCRLEAPTPGRLLVIAPHADDEAIACGGTLLRHRALGSEIHLVFVSDSSTGARDPAQADRMRRIRRSERRAATERLGAASVVELDLPDGALTRHEAAIAERLAERLRRLEPVAVFCPFPVDSHADHQATAVAMAAAAERVGWQGAIWAYEVWAPLWPNVAIDISEVAEAKAELIALYASQMGDRDYAAGILGLNRYRGLVHRVAHAEAFHRCTPTEFTALTRTLDRFD